MRFRAHLIQLFPLISNMVSRSYEMHLIPLYDQKRPGSTYAILKTYATLALFKPYIWYFMMSRVGVFSRELFKIPLEPLKVKFY